MRHQSGLFSAAVVNVISCITGENHWGEHTSTTHQKLIYIYTLDPNLKEYSSLYFILIKKLQQNMADLHLIYLLRTSNKSRSRWLCVCVCVLSSVSVRWSVPVCLWPRSTTCWDDSGGSSWLFQAWKAPPCNCLSSLVQSALSPANRTDWIMAAWLRFKCLKADFLPRVRVLVSAAPIWICSQQLPNQV